MKFTQEDILNALLALNEETRDSLMSLNFSGIVEAANNAEYLSNIYQTCDTYIQNYHMLKESLEEFVDTLEEHKRKGTEYTIDTMMRNYKGFTREEKLEFHKKLVDATSIESSMDNLKYTWGRFMETLIGATN